MVSCEMLDLRNGTFPFIVSQLCRFIVPSPKKIFGIGHAKTVLHICINGHSDH